MSSRNGANKNENASYSATADDKMLDNEPSDGPIQLKKQLGVMNGVGIIVGVIIGSGIFISPKGVLLNAGSVGLSMIVWLSCGLLVMCGALCYAELGTAIPKSGGEFAYLKESFGPLSAFLYLWVTFLIIYPTGNAIIALTFAEYMLQPLYSGCKAPDLAVQLLAAAVIFFLTFVNCYNVKWSTRITDSVAFAKVIALIIIICAGLYHLASGNTDRFSNVFGDTSTSFSDVALAFYSGMFSFSGWNCLNFVTEELKHPTRDLPRAIYISIPLISFIYLLTNLAYFSVMSTEEILASDAVAGDFGTKVLGVMAWIMPLCVALSCFGSLNGGIFACARLFFVGAREGHLPNIVSMITLKYLTPSPSLVFICVMTMVYLWVGGIYVLINFTSFIEALFLTWTTGALLYLRIKSPNTNRPIKVNLFFPIIFLLIGSLLVILPFYKSFVQTGIALLITLSGIPVYYIFVVWKTKPKWISGTSDKITKLIQLVLLCTPEEDNSWSEETTKCLSVSSIMDDTQPPFKKD